MKLRRPIQHRGIKRILIVLWPAAIWFGGWLGVVTDGSDIAVWSWVIMSALLYWPAIRIYLWIYDGFVRPKPVVGNPHN